MSIKETSANAATATAIGSGAVGYPGVVGWVNEYYQVIWLSISFFSALTALLFYYLNWRENRKRTEHLLKVPAE